MKLSEILVTKGSTVYTIAPEATLAELAQELVNRNCGSLVVVHEDRMVGIITERDFLRSYVATGRDLNELHVSDYMTTSVITGKPGDTVSDTMSLLTTRRIRHLPILDDDSQLAGLISIGDVVKSQIDQLAVENHFMKSYIQEVPTT